MARFNFLARGIQTLFPSSGTEMHSPSLLREEVQLVHPYPGRARAFDNYERLSVTTPNSTSPTGTIVTAGSNVWLEVLHADTSHISAAVRRILLRMVLSTGFTVELGRFEDLPGNGPFGEPWFGTGIGTTVTLSPRWLPGRPLWLPPDASLTHTGDTAAAGYTITTVMVAVRHPLLEEPIYG